MLAWLVAVAFAADVVAGHPRVRPAAVERVVLEAGHSGWHAQHQTLTIVRKGAGFTDGARKIDRRALEALVTSLSSAPVPTLEARRIPVDDEKLRAAVEDAATASYPREIVDDAVARYLDPPNITEQIRGLDCRGPVRTDDSPRARVEVTLEAGETIVATSSGGCPLMLPWTVQRRGQTMRNYNPDISRSIADLLPAGFADRERVTGDDLEVFLARGVRYIVPRPERNPDDVVHVEPRFTVTPAAARFRVSPRMFTDGTVKFQATLQNVVPKPITIAIAPGELYVRMHCGGQSAIPQAGRLTLASPPSPRRVLAPGESVTFEIPGLFTWGNEAHTHALIYTPVAGTCRLTFETWYRVGDAPAAAARRLGSNLVTLELVDSDSQ